DALLSRSVAALAIDAGRERFQVPGFRTLLAIGRRNPGVRIVTRHALVGDGASGARMVGPVVSRIHGEVAVFFGVPAERQLLKGSAGGEVEVGPGMVARPEHEVYLLLLDVGFFAVETELPAALEDAPAA